MTDPERRSSAPWWRPPLRGLPLVLTTLLAVVPVVRIVADIRRAPRMQYADYWPMLDSVMRVGGGLDVKGLFELRNEHPVAVAKLAYWVNARAFAGSNRSLAVGVILLGVAQVLVVAVAAARTTRVGWAWAPFVVAASTLVFARQGLWHFYKAMSGAAWLSADLFVLLALTAHHLRKTGLAIAAAVLATFSYATGLMVWPALIVATVLRDRSLRRVWPYAALGLLVAAWYVPAVRSSDPAGVGLSRGVIKRAFQLVGGFFYGHAEVSALRFGVAAVVVSVLLAAVLLVRRLRGGDDDGAGIWIGLLVYAGGCAASVSGGRDVFIFDYATSRYAAVGALLMLSLLGMLVTLLGNARSWLRWAPPTACALVVVAVSLGGGGQKATLDAGIAGQGALETAMQLDLAGGRELVLHEPLPVGIEEKLRSIDHLPFDGSYDLDCGLLGSKLPEEERSSTPASGAVQSVSPDSVPHGVRVSGWLDDDGRKVDCVIVTDEVGMVVGAAGVGPADEGYAGRSPEQSDHPLWFQGLAKADGGVSTFVRYAGDSAFHLVQPEVEP